MMNFIKKFDEEIAKVRKMAIKPKLLLHACCAPCLTSVLDTLLLDFDVTVFFYNPNIAPKEEYEYRLEEIKRYVSEVSKTTRIIASAYYEEEFYSAVQGLEGEREGGSRCDVCFDVRLSRTRAEAVLAGYDYFATTLTVSPLKSAEKINAIGERLSVDDCKYLVSDFKKRDGYKKSIELSTKYGLYRQNYCGCIFSKKGK